MRFAAAPFDTALADDSTLGTPKVAAPCGLVFAPDSVNLGSDLLGEPDFRLTASLPRTLEPTTGFEPVTPSLPRKCSTPEPRGLKTRKSLVHRPKQTWTLAQKAGV